MPFTNPDNNISQLHLQEGDRVVIFGSGAGGHSFAVARALRGTGQVIAIDVRRDMLNKLKNDAIKERLTNITPQIGNIEDTHGSKQQDGSIDAIIVPNTLFAYDDKPAILKEAYRILKTDGRLLIIDWRSSFAHMGPKEENVVSKQEAQALAEDAGFSFIQNLSVGDYHYGIVFIKKAPQESSQ